MIEFIDKTSSQAGTPLSRDTMMGIQGYISGYVMVKDDGSIFSRNGRGEELTVTVDESGNIVETFKGEKTITKTTSFMADGRIREVIS